jgi:hypothetical protein
VITLESVAISGGYARARVRLKAVASKFPSGSFGDAPLRLKVALNRVTRQGLMVFDTDDLVPGSPAVGDFRLDTYWQLRPGVVVFDVVGVTVPAP